MNTRILRFGLLGMMTLSLTGCPKKAEIKAPEEPKPEVQKPVTPPEEPSLRGKEYKEVPDISVVYFDLDQSTLRADARDTLQKNYQALQSHPDWEVLVEGHCDERGTTEYNLGLGQKRAAAVRQYYISLGYSGTKVATISYGKENPVCTEHTEDCWSKNRRGVTKVRINPDQPASTTPVPSGGAVSEPSVK
ncbi:MAG TPA: peptidoglycan-associated lipoprotein Pal [Elusimicrobiota bacterium]|nr:peptidoglycan-associated lipoprotein Pal [Elusimicrobiota bacterium]